ncbi:hypothetical protein D3C75_1004090 [compost metagenome]
MDVEAAGSNAGGKSEAAKRENFNTVEAAVVEFFAQLVNIFAGLQAVISGHKQGELLTSVARGNSSGFLGLGFEHLSDEGDQLVPLKMAEMVVIFLEIVKVNHRKRQRRTGGP